VTDLTFQQLGAVGIVSSALVFVFKLYRDAKQEQIDDLRATNAKLQTSCEKWEKIAWDSVQHQRKVTDQLGTAAVLTKEAVEIVADKKVSGP
jgi:hypothetical protein